MNKRNYNQPFLFLVFLICTCSVASADKSALVDDDRPGICETILESLPISRLIGEIAESALDRRVSYEIQVRTGSGDKFEFANLKRAASSRGVQFEILNVSTFRGNPVVDLKISGTGRRVIQTLMDVPNFKNGIFWMNELGTVAENEPSTGPAAIRSIAVGQFYNNSRERHSLLLRSLAQSERRGPLFAITVYGKYRYVALPNKIFMTGTPEELADSLKVLGIAIDYEGMAKLFERRSSRSIDTVQETQFNAVSGANLLKALAENGRLIRIVPKGVGAEDGDQHVVLAPLIIRPDSAMSL